MIPPEILNSKSLFSLLHKIDLELAERTRAQRCPIAGDRCIMPTIRESLGAALLILMRSLRSVIACAAVEKVPAPCSPAIDSILGPPGLLGACLAHRHRPSPVPASRTSTSIHFFDFQRTVMPASFRKSYFLYK